MKKFNTIDYKGKYFIIQDKDIDDEYGMDFVNGEITKKAAISIAEGHKENCRYYGIPPYIGKDKDLKKIYK